jgi:hypothetical protein
MDWLNALQHAMDVHRDRCVSPPLMQVISVSPGGNRFELELRFEQGKTYCCGESACFLNTFTEPWWIRFREALAERTDRKPPPLTMLVHGVIEEGAMLRSLLSFRPSMVSTAQSYRSEPYRERGFEAVKA